MSVAYYAVIISEINPMCLFLVGVDDVINNGPVYMCVSLIGCDDVVGPEGMEKFCEDIGVEPENVRMTMHVYVDE